MRGQFTCARTARTLVQRINLLSETSLNALKKKCSTNLSRGERAPVELTDIFRDSMTTDGGG